MQLLCAAPFFGFASRLRNRISPTVYKVSVLPKQAARSVRESVRSFHFYHSPPVVECDKILPKPAALGTSAMLGQVRARVVSKVEHACMGERVRFRQQMSTIHQNWEHGNLLRHRPNPWA